MSLQTKEKNCESQKNLLALIRILLRQEEGGTRNDNVWYLRVKGVKNYKKVDKTILYIP